MKEQGRLLLASRGSYSYLTEQQKDVLSSLCRHSCERVVEYARL